MKKLVLVMMVALAGCSASTDDAPPTERAFLVTDRPDWQQVNSIAIAPSGGFVVTWHDEHAESPDTDLSSVRARVFDAEATPLGDEFVVNTTTEGRQHLSSVAMFADGSFVVVFESLGVVTIGHEDGGSVLMRRFDGRGNAFGPDEQVFPQGTLSHVAILADESFVVVAQVLVVTETCPSGSVASAIHARRYSKSGLPLGAEIQVSRENQAVHCDSWPRVAAAPDGGFTVTYREENPPPNEPGGPLGRRFDADGQPLDAPFALGVGLYADHLVHLPSGGFVVLGAGIEPRGEDQLQRVLMRLFGPDGSPHGPSFYPHSTPADDADLIGAGLTVSGCDTAAGCTIIASWTRRNRRGDEVDFSIHGRAFDVEGNPVPQWISGDEGEFMLRETANGWAPQLPVVAGNASGRVVFAWIEQREIPGTPVSTVDGNIAGVLLSSLRR